MTDNTLPILRWPLDRAAIRIYEWMPPGTNFQVMRAATSVEPRRGLGMGTHTGRDSAHPHALWLSGSCQAAEA